MVQDALVQIKSQDMKIEDVKELLQSFSKERRYEAQVVIGEALLQQRFLSGKYIERFFSYVQHNDAWTAMRKPVQFKSDWQEMETEIKTHKSTKDRATLVRNQVLLLWDQEYNGLVNNLSKTAAETLQHLALTYKKANALARINAAMLQRFKRK